MLLLRGPNHELLGEIAGETTTLGRDTTNDVVLNDPSVSRFHAVILNQHGHLFIDDRGSTNGTLADGAKVRGRAGLGPWSSLQLGAVELRIEEVEAAAPGAAPALHQPDPIATPAWSRSAPAAAPVRPVLVPAAGQVSSSAPVPAVHPQSAPAQSAAVEPVLGPAAVQADAVAALPPESAPARPVSEHPASALFDDYPRSLGWLLFSFRGRINRMLWWLWTVGVLVSCWALSIAIVAVAKGGALWRDLVPDFGAAADSLMRNPEDIVYVFRDLRAETESALVIFGTRLVVVIVVLLILYLLTNWVLCALAAKRLHDSGRRLLPWVVYSVVLFVLSIPAGLLALIPIVNLLVAFASLLSFVPYLFLFCFCAFAAGTFGANAFGAPNPVTRPARQSSIRRHSEGVGETRKARNT